MDGIFISYRRDDSAGYAGRLYDRLAAHFGAERVFMDVEGIEPGLDFVDAIEEAVSSCRVLIAVIGDEWTNSADAAGRRRLDDPNDFIRLETGAALKRGIRVVPVLVGGAVMPLAAELPEELKALTRRQAIEINHKQWEASTGELIRTLESILKTPPADAAASKQPSADPHAAKVSAASGSMAGNAAATQGNSRRWALPAVIAAVALVAAGLWMIPGDRKSGADTEKQTVGKAVEAPAGAVAPGPKDAGPAVTPPAPASVAPPKPAAPEKIEPVPVAKPVATPAPVAPAAAVPAPVPPPVIREFKADVSAARTRLCYRVSNADSLTLSPRPGELDNAASDCIEVKVDATTTFTLTARNASATTRKTLAVLPLPAEAPPARAVAPAAAPAPAATPAVVASSSLPVKGERWVYRSSGKWPTSPKRRYEIVAQSVADNLVTDELRLIEPESGAEVRRARGNKPDFIAWNAIGPEFSPYFGAFVELAGQSRLSGLPTPDLHPQWTNWYSKAEVIGRETVSVPAGAFNAFKVEVWSSRNRTGSQAEAQMEPVRVNYVIWYAPEIKRYVRMQRVVSTVANSESEKDVFELVAHRLP
ncbi:MAG: toll/interleukin-1 receptor domain-containing protein [Azonexus sp.]|nr:toll/interleukin-1 receptor domain-containing protein [Azonexus sp.]